MNPDSGAIANTSLLDALKIASPLTEWRSLDAAFQRAYPHPVPEGQLAEAYRAEHNGHARHARRAMDRDIAKGRVPNSIRRRLLGVDIT